MAALAACVALSLNEMLKWLARRAGRGWCTLQSDVTPAGAVGVAMAAQRVRMRSSVGKAASSACPPPAAAHRCRCCSCPSFPRRQLSLDDGKPGRRPQDEQQQQQRRQQQQQERQEAKARAQAAAAGQPRPPPPKGPCGCPAPLPAGGAVHPLPLAAALRKGCPPWNLGNNPDLSCAQLVPGQDALHVRYPAGSSTPSSGRRGGVLLRGAAAGLPATDALLQFDFRTDPGFDWTRGGKLGGGLQIGRQVRGAPGGRLSGAAMLGWLCPDDGWASRGYVCPSPPALQLPWQFSPFLEQS